MEMSEDSHSNGSAGSLRGFKSLFSKKDKSEEPELLCRYDQNPSRTRKSSVLGSFQSRKEDYTPGVPGLDRYGYEKYNVMESEIYISCPSASAAFDDMEPTIIRATNGNVVGSRDEVRAEEPTAPANRASHLYDPFESIDTGSSLPKSFECVHGSVRDGTIVRDNAAPELPKIEYSTEIDEDGFLFKPVVDEPAPVDVEAPAEPSAEDLGTIEAPEADPTEVFTESPAEDDVLFDAAVETEEITADIVEAAVENAEAPAEQPEEVDIVGAPIEAAENVEVPDEIPVVEPVEHIAAAEIPVEAPAEEIPAEVAVEEIPVEVPVVEAMVVVPVLPENKFEGLYVEGDSEDKPSLIDSELVNNVAEPEAAETSKGEVDTEPKPAPIAGIDTEGASVLPPMSVNPAKPRVRFKFINGVLTKVIEEEPAEPDEGLRGPFDIAAGEAVERIGPARAKPVEKPVEKPEESYVIEMDDEFDSVPEPDYGGMVFDDALESLTFDAVPPTVIAELIDLMPLSYPEMDVDVDWSCPADADDGLEAACFAEPVRFEVPELPVMIGAASEPLMIGGASEPLMIGASADETLMIGASEVETPMLGAAEPVACIAAPEQAAVTEPAMAPEAEAIINGVVFSFGSRTGAGSVTFSF